MSPSAGILQTSDLPRQSLRRRIDGSGKGLGVAMASVCFYFQVHQPLRLRHYTVFDNDDRYFDEAKNAAICKKVANKCYLPANRMLLKLIQQHQGRFRIAYSLTGVLLEQLERYCPEVLSTFHALAQTGLRGVPRRDVLPQPELSLLAAGVRRAGHRSTSRRIEELFGQTPQGLPQHRADLQQRPRPAHRGDGLLRRHHHGGGRPHPRLPQRQLRLPAPGLPAAEAAAEELLAERRHRVSLLQPAAGPSGR